MLDCIRIGKKLQYLRNNKNFNQEELASKLHVTRQAISRWENGETMPTIDNLVELTKIFEVSFEEILCINDKVEMDKENIFKGHDRHFIIQKICKKDLDVKISDIFYQLSNEERIQVLASLIKNHKEIDDDLKCKLTSSEQRFIQNNRLKNRRNFKWKSI